MTAGSYLWSFLYILHTYLILSVKCQEKIRRDIVFL